MTYEQAKRQAIANADYFQRPYYVVSSTLGYYAERDAPSAENAQRIMYVAQPVKVQS
jgi:hypothetical protein